jgi:hypothetical protein
MSDTTDGPCYWVNQLEQWQKPCGEWGARTGNYSCRTPNASAVLTAFPRPGIPLPVCQDKGVFVSPDQEREHAASAMMRGWCAFERMLHDWFDTRKNTAYNVSVCILFYPVEEVCSTTRSLFLPEKEAQLAHCGW